VGYRRGGEEIVHQDYAGSDGKTVRFGDNAFGKVPDNRMFHVSYRLGNGRRGNVAADALVNFDSTSMTFVDSITNPLPAENGADAETADEVKQLAPEAFRAVTYRAVREEDYREAAERLAWVQRAGAQFRWTGSWLTAFVTPDPLGAVSVTENQRGELAVQLDRFRQAGREAVVTDPTYADIDLIITVCVQPFAYPGDVAARVLTALVGNKKTIGFFSADNYTFGDPLRRSQLEAVIQRVPGVRAAGEIQIRRRGYFDWQVLTGPYEVGHREVLRLENDPDYPERGTLELILEGGA
jgi:predicted phage baseplate assembly protein